jgi:hypothetical protein
MASRRCFFAGLHNAGPCDGRVFVLACGGATGIGGHHGQLDSSRTIRVPRHRLPPELEEFAAEHGLGWFLDREYGPAL